MAKKKRIRYEHVPPSMRDRVDMDYIDSLDKAAQKFMKQFVEETFGRKFHAKSFYKSKLKRKDLHREVYEARNDIFNVHVRVDVDPTVTELREQKVPENIPRPKRSKKS